MAKTKNYDNKDWVDLDAIVSIVKHYECYKAF